jgi:hypothetical protein
LGVAAAPNDYLFVVELHNVPTQQFEPFKEDRKSVV